MILVNLVVPYEIEINFDSKKIITEYRNNRLKNKLFVIEVDEEELVYLKLRFGNDNVWKR